MYWTPMCDWTAGSVGRSGRNSGSSSRAWAYCSRSDLSSFTAASRASGCHQLRVPGLDQPRVPGTGPAGVPGDDPPTVRLVAVRVRRPVWQELRVLVESLGILLEQ